jgi:hypothetical protein
MTYGTDGSVAVDVDPDAARGEVTVKKGDTVIASGTLGDAGKTDIVIPGDSLPTGTNVLTVAYAGNGAYNGSSTTVTIEVAKATPTVTAVATPSTVKVKKGTSVINVTVAADGYTPTGFVSAYLDGELLSFNRLSDGKTSITVGPFDTTGTKTIEVVYEATDGVTEGATTSTSITVQKATPKVKVKGPNTAKVGSATPKVTVSVSADGMVPTGTVVFRVDGVKVASKSLSGGSASVTLKKFRKAGNHPVEVTYKGSDLLVNGSDTHVIKAVR